MGSFSGAPIKVVITADDLTQQAFASASARAQAFGAVTGGSMREATASARLFRDELGVQGVGRELTNLIGRSQLLGPLLQTMFPVAAALGFVSVAKSVYEAIVKMAEAAGGYSQAMKDADKAALTANQRALANFKTVAQGYQLLEAYNQMVSGAGARSAAGNLSAKDIVGFISQGQAGITAMIALIMASRQASNEEKASEESRLIVLQHLGEVKLKDAKEAEDAEKKALELVKQQYAYTVKIAEQSHIRSQAELGIMTVEDLKRLGVYTDTAPNLTFGAKPFPSFGGGGGSPLYGGGGADLVKIQTDQAAAIAAATKAYEGAATATQQYSDQVAILIELYNQGRITESTFVAGVEKAAQVMDKSKQMWEHLGQQIGDTISQAALFSRSWSDALKSILIDIGRVIAQMYLLKALGPNMGGGIGGAILSGLVGLAGGGAVYAGTPYMVGESGPELFVPGSNGSIVPNGGGANVQVNVINQSSQPVSGHAGQATFDGEKYVVNVMLKDLAQNGPFRQALSNG